jgi:serine/threonine protein kinase
MHPTTLPPGSIVGSWRLLALTSRGSFGAVFRAESTTAPASGPVALKLALQPGDPRFALEAAFLSRLHHPNLPCLHDSGEWRSSDGTAYAFLVMDWVDGLPLYSWARLWPRSSREVLRVLAQGARALQAIHAAGGLHRDVKGDHFLVRPEDGHAVLVDFGSCTFRGAPVITRNSGPPSTPQYLSPQSHVHQWRFRRDPTARYEPSVADDVYALGVTAYRLVTERYPVIDDDDPGMAVSLDEDSPIIPKLVPADALVQLSPELARWIRQMLSVEPSARGLPAELASGLERSANTEGPEADKPIRPRTAPPAPRKGRPLRQPLPPMPSRILPWPVVLGATALCFAFVAAGAGWLHSRLEQSSSSAPPQHTPWQQPSTLQAETSGLGELAPPEPLSSSEPIPHEGINAPIPETPLPGQRTPPCPKPSLEINGGCWILVGNETPPCSNITYEWRKRCYLPFMSPSRPLNTREK